MNEYIFKYEPHKKILAFTTLGGHASGVLLKNIKFITPSAIDKMKEQIEEIGQVISIDNYVFIVMRKHYNTRVKKEMLVNALAKVPKELIFKTTKEDYSALWEEVEIPANIEFYDSSCWKDAH